MPRVYKPLTTKRYKKYDSELIKKAVKELEAPNAVLSAIAKKYDINKSVLYRHSTKVMKRQGGQMALSEETEAYLVVNINKCSEWGYPMDTMDLRHIIKMYLDKSGVQHKKFKNNLPGPDYVHGFLKRNKGKVANRIVENIKRARAEVSPDSIKKYFAELEISLEGVPASNIVNYDETNLCDDPGRLKALVKRGCKYPERKLDSTKASVSIMLAGTAEGKLLPPYVVYKAKHLYDTWVEHGPVGARYNRSSSGWFEGQIFEDWVINIAIPYFKNKSGRKCLIGDNLSSHVSISLIQVCKEQNIDFIFLPANSTHLTQPLDVAFFRPMKIAWRKLLLVWKKTDGRNLSTILKGCFPKLLKLLFDDISINSKNNLISGFRKTGILPLDPNEVLSRLPMEPSSEEETQTAIDDAVLTLLREMRYGSINIKQHTRKRKLNVVAGRSVVAEMINKALENVTPDSPENAIPSISENATSSTPNSNTRKKTLKGKGVGKKTKTQNLDVKKEVIEIPKDVNARINAFDEENNLPVETKHAIDKNNTLEELNIEAMPVLFFDAISCEEVIVQSSDVDNTNENNEKPKTDESDCKENKQKNKVKIISEKVFHNTQGSKKILMTDCKQVSLHDPFKFSKNQVSQTHSSKPPAKPGKMLRDNVNYFNNKEEIFKVLLEED